MIEELVYRESDLFKGGLVDSFEMKISPLPATTEEKKSKLVLFLKFNLYKTKETQ